MRILFLLTVREVRAFFHSPVAYIVLAAFLLICGWSFFVSVDFLNGGRQEYTVLQAFFLFGTFWFGFLPIFPLLTMRLFSEEFKMGTIETLLTAPVEDWQVVLSKYIATVIFYITLCLPTFLYFRIFAAITDAAPVLAPGAYFGTAAILLCIGMFYLAIGCLGSVLTKNQIVAAVLSFALIAISFFSGIVMSGMSVTGSQFHSLIYYISTVQHVYDFSRGVFDTRPIVLYLSLTGLLLAATYQIFLYRRWKT